MADEFLRIDEFAPLDYFLVPTSGELIPLVAKDTLRQGRITTVYVWGYGPPQSLLCREQCEPSWEAERFAAESGWDETKEGAWAKEIFLAAGLLEAQRALEPIFRRDTVVAGWGIRTVRRP
jgi:hypothetical protein